MLQQEYRLDDQGGQQPPKPWTKEDEKKEEKKDPEKNKEESKQT